MLCNSKQFNNQVYKPHPQRSVRIPSNYTLKKSDIFAVFPRGPPLFFHNSSILKDRKKSTLATKLHAALASHDFFLIQPFPNILRSQLLKNLS